MKYIDADKLIAKIKELNLVTTTYDEQVAFNNALAMVVEIIDSLQQEQPAQKKNCAGCPHCIDRKDQYGWHFKGCFGGPYKGKFIAEIDECPLQQEQPEVNIDDEIDKVIADYSFTKTIDSGGFKTTVLDYEKIARHFYELGRNARKEE